MFANVGSSAENNKNEIRKVRYTLDWKEIGKWLQDNTTLVNTSRRNYEPEVNQFISLAFTKKTKYPSPRREHGDYTYRPLPRLRQWHFNRPLNEYNSIIPLLLSVVCFKHKVDENNEFLHSVIFIDWWSSGSGKWGVVCVCVCLCVCLYAQVKPNYWADSNQTFKWVPYKDLFNVTVVFMKEVGSASLLMFSLAAKPFPA